MPDLTASPPALTPPPLPKDALAPFSDADARKQRFDTATKAIVGQMEDTARDTRSRNDKLEGALELQKPPQMQQVPYKPPHGTDPVEEWGSAAMIFATLGSLFTRRPMVTALNAATSALNAFKQGDQQAAKTYYEQWKVANDNAMALAKYQQDAYQNVMKSYERREANNTAAGAAQERALQAQMTALAAGFRDQNMLAVMQNRGIQGANNETDRRQKQIEDMDLKTKQMQLRYQQNQINEQITGSPEYKAAAARKDSMEMLRLMAQGGDPRAIVAYAKGQAKQASVTAKADTKATEVKAMAQTTQDHIDQALELIPEIGGGAISQIYEKQKERIGSNILGLHMENPAQMYDSYIDAIKLDILAQQKSAGTRNVEFRKALDSLLPSIMHWEGSAGQEIRLKILANVIARSQGLPDRFKDVSGQTPTVPVTPDLGQPGQPGAPAQMHATPASTGGARPGGMFDTSRTPTDADRKAAVVVRSPAEAESAPAGWVTDGKGHYFFKQGGAATPSSAPPAPAPAPVPGWNPPAGLGVTF